jgi:hypothetical protein
MGEDKYINGYKIPPGYTFFENFGRRFQAGDIDQDIYWFNNIHPHTLDQKNPEYKKIIAQCKRDTKNLGNALQTQMDEMGVPFWTRRRAIKKSLKNTHRKVSFFIKPVFFSTSVDVPKEDRMYNDSTWDAFMLHFDENHKYHMPRFWVSDKKYIDDFRMLITKRVGQVKEALSEHYGDWEKMAIILAHILEEAYRKHYFGKNFNETHQKLPKKTFLQWLRDIFIS